MASCIMLFDGIFKVKCQKYWPVTEAELFGSLTVNPIEEWELADYTIRKFQMQQVIIYFGLFYFALRGLARFYVFRRLEHALHTAHVVRTYCA